VDLLSQGFNVFEKRGIGGIEVTVFQGQQISGFEGDVLTEQTGAQFLVFELFPDAVYPGVEREKKETDHQEHSDTYR